MSRPSRTRALLRFALSQRWARLFSLVLSAGLFLSLCLPWFGLPVLGWSVPAPAWNRAGFFLFLLIFCNCLRAAGGASFRWLVRLSLCPAGYYWWSSKAAVENWGIKTFGPLQLKLSGVNSALSRLGVEPVELFVAREWRNLEPQFGWYVAGGGLLLTFIVTALDRSNVAGCPDCRTPVDERDHFCRGCGLALTSRRLCSNCVAELSTGDRFCRRCGFACESVTSEASTKM